MKRNKLPASVKSGVWPRVDGAAVPAAQWEVFLKRRLAVELYVSGVSQSEIKLRTNFGAGELHRLVDRFLSVNDQGQIFGEFALLPGFRVKHYTRVKPVKPKRTEQRGGMSGMLDILLTDYPEIEAFILTVIEDNAQTFTPVQNYTRYLVAKFYEALKRTPRTLEEWPYSTKHKGRRSIEKYVNDLVALHMARFVYAHGDSMAVAHIRTGTGNQRLIRAKRPADIAELDGHFIDAIFVIRVELMPGYFQEVTISRIWLLCMIDAFSKAVLAYKLVFRSEVSAADVREVIAQAVVGEWAPKVLTHTQALYLAGSGLPSASVPGWKGMTFSCLYVDGHLSNVAEKIVTDARQDFCFMHCLGPAGHFESRPNIERLFREVARQVQLLPSTTGGAPNRGRARDAEGKAMRYHINIAAFEEAMDVALANYCTMPNEGNGYLSPIAVLTQCLQGGAVMPIIPEVHRDKLQADLCTKTVTVRGSITAGRRPFVQLDRVHYSSEILSDSALWIGKKILVEINHQDYRAVKAYLPSGQSLGFLQAMGWWGEFKHSVTVRRQVNKLVSAGELRILRGRSPIQQISDYFMAHGQPLQAFDLAKSQDPDAKEVSRQPASPAPRVPDYFLLPGPLDPDIPLPGTAENRRQK
ncbi:hypothetical protein ACS77_02205 [Pseudomonas syringae]|uniref:Integrase catalytic domain-containing protein n=1 Tax=Pseudomonas syringae TaxID=317 RepID=A0A0L1MLZ1_PSESX|nr:hypothetical protein ACS77_02205 [Pseudomonas syringae]